MPQHQKQKTYAFDDLLVAFWDSTECCRQVLHSHNNLWVMAERHRQLIPTALGHDLSTVMAGLRPGHPRLCLQAKPRLDARDKRGHDESRAAAVGITWVAGIKFSGNEPGQPTYLPTCSISPLFMFACCAVRATQN
jgi:hypothetical protein